MKRKRSKGRETIQFRTGEPLKYGSNWKLPRPQERVPRSILHRPLMLARRVSVPVLGDLVRLPSAERSSQLKVPRKRVVAAPRSRSTWRRFVFNSPFSRQYQFLLSAGRMVSNPKRVAFCVKRKIRREVLFAFRRAGYRGSGPGRRRTYRRHGNSLHGC